MTDASTEHRAERYKAELEDVKNLSPEHRRELLFDSAINADVAEQRGYATIERPNRNGEGTVPGLPKAWQVFPHVRDQLKHLGFPTWATREDYFYPALWIPQYTPNGTKYAGQFKPKAAVVNRDGKKMKYASAKGAARLDVHPRWSFLSDDVVPPIKDSTKRLWITEGVKKADSLTSRDEVTVALAGVFNWRNQHGALGDWEDVALRDREVVVCFDADARTKPAVAQAMGRLGKWLRYKGAAKVHFLVVPAAVNGKGVKGVDDYFAAGGNLKELEREFSPKPPDITDTSDAFTDARLAETLANEVLDGAYVWAAGLDWLAWNGQVWRESHEVTVLEAVRQWALDHFAEAADAMRMQEKEAGALVEGWRAMLSSSRAKAVLSLARGIVQREAGEFDADPDIINTPDGIVRLDTGEVLPHDPDALCTKITSGSYRPGYTHPDWDRALEVLPPDVADWFAVRVGQAITGHTTDDGVVPILKGGGENGKGLLMTDGILPAMGGYASAASPKLFEKGQHSTEQADLRGRRLVIAEELTEGRSIDVGALKRVADVGVITARKTHKDNMSFAASHSLFATTNYTPVISETDHGTWRRLALVVFPYTYVKPGRPITDPEVERRGDPTLKGRIKVGRDGQHDAAVTWAVEGARRWYASQAAIEAARAARTELPASASALPPAVEADTLAWREDADRILGYWRARLVTDPAAAVLSSELIDDFNEWLTGNGHAPWAKETLRPRFIEHTCTKSARVTMRKAARPATLKGYRIERRGRVSMGVEKPLPKQADLFLGVRWRTDEDDA